jgi:hypothetical protein
LIQKEIELVGLNDSVKNFHKKYLEGKLYVVCSTCGKDCSLLGTKGHWTRYLFREYGQNKKAIHIPKEDVPKIQQKIIQGEERKKFIKQKQIMQKQFEKTDKRIREILEIWSYTPPGTPEESLIN